MDGHRGGARRRGALPSHGRGPRTRGPRRPADPGVAVRVGGGGGPGRVLRRAGHARGPSHSSRSPHERPLFRMPVAIDVVCGALGIVAFAVVVYAGFAGTQAATSNLEPTVIYVLFWVGLPVLSVLLGDVFRLFNPWRALGPRRRVDRQGDRGDLPEPLEYPERLGPLAGRGGDPHLRLGRARVLQPRRAPDARDHGPGLRRLPAARDGPVRHRALVHARRRVRCLLRPLRAAVGAHAPGKGDPRAAPAHRPARARRRSPARWCCSSSMIGSTTFDGFSMGTIWTSWTPAHPAVVRRPRPQPRPRAGGHVHARLDRRDPVRLGHLQRGRGRHAPGGRDRAARSSSRESSPTRSYRSPSPTCSRTTSRC